MPLLQISNKATEKNEEFKEKYNAMLNRFSKEFLDTFCLSNGTIDWYKLVEINSGLR
ncbi:MAG: hypothetical protein LBE74_03760 [Treponema sp.]|jgi:hypothetical protein|nr:hypothetical protein [Treponema sp.]